jgi:hypothetical protein
MRAEYITRLATALVIATPAIAAVTKLAPEDRAALENPHTIQLVHSVRAIPASVKSACAAVISEHRFWLADPGKPYNETDAEWDTRLPGRRLLWAARLPEHYVIHYESGGIAHGFHLIIVKSAGPHPRVVWRCVGPKYKDYSPFLGALKQNKPDDTLDYMF